MNERKLQQQVEERLAYLSKLPKLKSDSSIMGALEGHGFSRRDFMKWAGAMTAFL